MFTVSVETHFWASHQLGLADGGKEPLHWHNWSVTAEVGSNRLNSIGLVMDFRHLKEMVEEIVAGLGDAGGQGEGKIGHLQQDSSSAEAIAKYIYEKLEPKLPQGVRLEAVRVAEGPGWSAKFAK